MKKNHERPPHSILIASVFLLFAASHIFSFPLSPDDASLTLPGGSRTAFKNLPGFANTYSSIIAAKRWRTKAADASEEARGDEDPSLQLLPTDDRPGSANGCAHA